MHQHTDRMPDALFKIMKAVMVVKDRLFPSVKRRLASFGVRERTTVVDYGCGPGRYTVPLSAMVGQGGKVYAVDVHELAIQEVEKAVRTRSLANVIPLLAVGYQTGIPAASADMILALLDMFFLVKDPTALLAELRRIVRPEGVLILDDGHAPRDSTLQKLNRSGMWRVKEETADHLLCVPRREDAGSSRDRWLLSS